MFDPRSARELSMIQQLAEAYDAPVDEWLNDPHCDLGEALHRTYMLRLARQIAREATTVRITSTVPSH